MIASLLLFAPFFVVSIALALAAIGLVFAPIAFITLAFFARSKGTNPYVTAAFGALYSLLFFVPLIYFALRLTNRNVSPNLVLFAYAFLYFVWLFGIVGVFMTLAIVSEDPSAVSFFLILFTLTTISASVWRLLIPSDRNDSSCRIPIRRLTPFITAYLNLLLAFVFAIPPAPLAGML